MPDNLGYTPGAGASIATDEIAGQHYQRVKPVVGIDGQAVDVSDTSPMPVRDESVFLLFKRLLNALTSPAGYDRALQRQRMTGVIESGTVTTVTTVTTCSTVTNLSTIDTLQGRLLVLGQNASAWASVVRSRIT
jgi:hypothetical protein